MAFQSNFSDDLPALPGFSMQDNPSYGLLDLLSMGTNTNSNNPIDLNQFTMEGSSSEPLQTVTEPPCAGFSPFAFPDGSFNPFMSTQNPSAINGFPVTNNNDNDDGYFDLDCLTLFEPNACDDHGENDRDTGINEAEDAMTNEGNDQTGKAKVQQRAVKGPNCKIIKGQWTPQEDRLLRELMEQYGEKKWSYIANKLQGRTGKQCRERWVNQLNPHIKKESWTTEEDKLLVQAHKSMGNRWAEMARIMPGRTDNAIKNHWNASVRKHMTSLRMKRDRKSRGDSPLMDYIRSIYEPETGTIIHPYRPQLELRYVPGTETETWNGTGTETWNGTGIGIGTGTMMGAGTGAWTWTGTGIDNGAMVGSGCGSGGRTMTGVGAENGNDNNFDVGTQNLELGLGLYPSRDWMGMVGPMNSEFAEPNWGTQTQSQPPIGMEPLMQDRPHI